MREIKFRYRYTDGQNWIMKVFNLAQIANGDPFEVLSDQPLLRNYKHVGEDQYTGLKDKNGKEIYEGDVAKMYMNGFKIGSDEIIEFKNGSFWLRYRDTPIYAWFTDETFEGELEIIGNIYESAEIITQ